MNKIKEFLTNFNYSILGFTIFAVRLAFLGASIGDAIALFAFGGLYAFTLWLKKAEITKYNEKFQEDVKIEFVKAAEEINKIKSSVSAMSIGAAYSNPLRKFNGPGQ